MAYVLKGYPRLSELFIASEIWRLEQLGLDLQLYVCRPPDEDTRHPIVDRIKAEPTWLPATTSLSATTAPRWLARNLPVFAPALRRVARRRPRGLADAARTALGQAIRARLGWRPRRVYLKELLWAVALADAIDRGPGVDHLHAHFAHGTTTVAWLGSRILGVPFSFTGHAKDIYRESLNPAGLLRRKLDEAAFAVTCTGANLDHLRAIAPDARIHLVYHGLNAELTALLDAAPAAERPPHLRIVSVGRLVPKKGFDVLIQAVGQLHRSGTAVELVVAGETGSEAVALADLVTELGLDGVVRFRGTISQAQLLTELRRSSVFALACRVDDDGDRDGIPNVLVEAMAAGLPAVSTTVSGIPELVTDGVTGLLVPPDDPGALADALRRLAREPELAGQLARAGTAAVHDRFDGERLAHQLVLLFAGREPVAADRTTPTPAGRRYP
ncbi:MAG: glycosyltransferase family 4 protein [Acidimicrobiia bacterium]|nr:glycosyltransferase family 4 protein [Acidimicrobiia bacterium]